MPTITTHDGYTLFYETHGDSTLPPLVLVHGWLMNRHFWDSTIPQLQDHYYCIAVDVIGAGDSDHPADIDYKPMTQAHRLVDLLDALELDTVRLMGHSMGAFICGHVAARVAPDRVSHFVSVGGLMTGRGGLGMYLRVPLIVIGAAFPPALLFGREVVKLAPIAWLLHGQMGFYNMWSVGRQNWYHNQLSIYSLRHGRSHVAMLRELRPDYDLTPFMGDIRANVLAISGVQDRVVPVEQAHTLAERAPNATLVTIDRCGHQPNFECPDKFLPPVLDFLASE